MFVLARNTVSFSLETLGKRRGSNGIDFLIRAQTAKVFDVTGCLLSTYIQQCCECDSHGDTKSRLSIQKKKATRALVFGGAFRAINFPLQTDIPFPCKNEDN